MADKVRILLVEGEPFSRFIQAELALRGYEVHRTSSGTSAIELVWSWQPNLILLESCLPDADGYDICEHIRALSPVPIIMLASLAEPADKVKGLTLGADDYVSKPLSLTVLVARIRAVLRRVEQFGPIVSWDEARISEQCTR